MRKMLRDWEKVKLTERERGREGERCMNYADKEGEREWKRGREMNGGW